MRVVLALSIRQLAGGKRIWLMLVLAAIPLVFAVIFTLVDSEATASQLRHWPTNASIASQSLPLVTPFLATAAVRTQLASRPALLRVLTPQPPRWEDCPGLEECPGHQSEVHLSATTSMKAS